MIGSYGSISVACGPVEEDAADDQNGVMMRMSHKGMKSSISLAGGTQGRCKQEEAKKRLPTACIA